MTSTNSARTASTLSRLERKIDHLKDKADRLDRVYRYMHTCGDEIPAQHRNAIIAILMGAG